MRVILLVTDHQRGGSPLRLARLARGLRDAGVEVHAGCLAPPGPISVELQTAGIPTFACGAEDARDFLALARLSQHVRRIRPDLIHATLTHANVAARIVGVVQRVPVIGSTATIEIERPWHRSVERATARIDRAHIVNSQAVAEHVISAFGIARRRVHVIPPSLDPFPQLSSRAAARAALEIPEHEFVVAWVGRLDPVKRIELLIGCAEILTSIPIRFLIVGDGPHRGHVEQTLKLSSAARVVHLLGWRTDVTAILSAADAFLFPSLTEGMPNAVLEALACGLPVVGSDIPVLRELAGGEERLLLVSDNQPAAFAGVLARLHAEPDVRRALGERGATWARANLSLEATVQTAVRIYENVLPRVRRC
jgi:glycosyltransferase involved in cell wall biosynthesis